MEQNYISYISYLSGGALFTCLTLTFIYWWYQKLAHRALIIAGVTSIIWQLTIAGHYQYFSLNRELLPLLETLRYGAWINALLATLHFTIGQPLPSKFQRLLQGSWLFSLTAIIVIIASGLPLAQDSRLMVWNSLILSIVGLIAAEQLFRNSPQHRFTKLLSIGIGALLAYDTYLFSHSLIFNQIHWGLWQSRGAVSGLIALFLIIGIIRIPNPGTNKLSVSRPVVFYTTSITAASSFLALMALGGYYIQFYGGRWGNIIQILVLFSALFSLVALFSSQTIRSRLKVFINKHFFRHKYDYRVEWLKLIRSLSNPTQQENFQERAISVTASLFKCQGGSLWLENNGYYQVNHIYKIPQFKLANIKERIDSPFCKTMKEEEWIFSPYTSKPSEADNADLSPDWLSDIPDLWLALPLITDHRLIGFIILVGPRHDAQLSWEDIDLLKTVGRQVASYLDRLLAAELLTQSKQFDTFNKLTAFIMHDLKNLIAQQALVVENAAKHKDNPAFIDDAIQTIDNSVNRMNNLLRRLQKQEASVVKSLNLDKVMIEVARKCHEAKPSPAIRFESRGTQVVADEDLLIMTLANIIQNAQDATNPNGFVDVTLREQDKNAIITIEDNGCGMDIDFIQNRLFKPFDSTKAGKGMGIGVYQTREFINSLGGALEVESTPDEGTTFTITIPSTPPVIAKSNN